MNRPEPQTIATDQGAPIVAAVPRVNISIFCTTQSTVGVMQQATNDRRMARAHVDLREGGIMEAARAFSQTTTPDVLILETEGHRDEILSELSQLAQVCDSSTKVILIGHVNDAVGAAGQR